MNEFKAAFMSTLGGITGVLVASVVIGFIINPKETKDYVNKVVKKEEDFYEDSEN